MLNIKTDCTFGWNSTNNYKVMNIPPDLNVFSYTKWENLKVSMKIGFKIWWI